MSVDSAAELVERYLAAYKAGDIEGMNACTDPEFTFCDPAFSQLDAKRTRGMFAMFIKGRDTNKMQVEYRDIMKGTNDLTYTATYTVRYLFGGRPVTNVINATFTVSPTSNVILSQVDTFPFWTWSRQALGVPGLLLGWSGYLQGKVQHTANARLDKFMSSEESS